MAGAERPQGSEPAGEQVSALVQNGLRRAGAASKVALAVLSAPHLAVLRILTALNGRDLLAQGYSGYIPACEAIPYSVKDETRRLVPAASMQCDVRRPVCLPACHISLPSKRQPIEAI